MARLSDAALLAQIASARERGDTELRSGLRATMRQHDMEEFARRTAEQAVVVTRQWEESESRRETDREARASRLARLARTLLAREDPRAWSALEAIEADPSPGTHALRPYDLVVALALACGISASAVGEALSLDAAFVGPALDRLERAGFLCLEARSDPVADAEPETRVRLNREALREFLVHGVRYAFPAWPGGWTRGVPTAHAAVDLEDGTLRDPEAGPDVLLDDPVVWPAEAGPIEGAGVTPLFRFAPALCTRAPEVYRMLALVDCLRLGGIRERTAAHLHLRRALGLSP